MTPEEIKKGFEEFMKGSNVYYRELVLMEEAWNAACEFATKKPEKKQKEPQE